MTRPLHVAGSRPRPKSVCTCTPTGLDARDLIIVARLAEGAQVAAIAAELQHTASSVATFERGKAHLRVGRDPADEVVVPARVLVEWALARLDDTDAAWLAELVKARSASVAQWDRITRCRPRDTLPVDLLATVRAAEANQHAAELRIAELTATVLARDDVPEPSQLDLFAGGAA